MMAPGIDANDFVRAHGFHEVFALQADPLHRTHVVMQHENAMQFFIRHFGALNQYAPANAVVQML
jgi:hypothetical protein